MLWPLVGLMLFFLGLGVIAHAGGSFVHLLLGLAVLMLLFKVIRRQQNQL